MYARIILTTGTSALAPQNLGKWARTQDVFAWPGRDPVVPAGRPMEEVFEAWAAALRSPPDFDPVHTSAEISTLNALKKLGRMVKAPSVVLIHTETVAGRAAAAIVKRAASVLFDAHVTLRSIGGLDARSPRTLRAALGTFMCEVAESLEAGEPRTTCFAPIGGYKVMTSLGYLAGAYLGFPTAYIHEDLQVLHTVPAVPVNISETEMKTVGPLVRRVGEAMEVCDLTELERAQVDRHGYLFEQDGEVIGMSPFCHFLRARPALRPILGTQVVASAQAAAQLDGHRAFVAKELDDLLRDREISGKRAVLYHEKSFGRRDALFHLYKGSSGMLPFRAAWRYVERTDTLEVNHIWLKHDQYEREAKGGVGLLERAETWENITERLFSPR